MDCKSYPSKLTFIISTTLILYSLACPFTAMLKTLLSTMIWSQQTARMLQRIIPNPPFNQGNCNPSTTRVVPNLPFNRVVPNLLFNQGSCNPSTARIAGNLFHFCFQMICDCWHRTWGSGNLRSFWYPAYRKWTRSFLASFMFLLTMLLMWFVSWATLISFQQTTYENKCTGDGQDHPKGCLRDANVTDTTLFGHQRVLWNTR